MMGRKQLVDIPIMYCPNCKMYYTPYSNLLASTKLEYYGCQIASVQCFVEKSFPRVAARSPYFIDIEEDTKTNEQLRSDGEKEHEQQVILHNAEKSRRTLEHWQMIVTNKEQFCINLCCPKCGQKTFRKVIKIKNIPNENFFAFEEAEYCVECKKYFFTKEKLCSFISRMRVSFPNAPVPFVIPSNARIECNGDVILILPRAMLNKKLYNHPNLPSKHDLYYDPSPEEFAPIEAFYQPDKPFSGRKIKQKSFLRRAGYSADLPAEERRCIVDKCITENGEDKVLKTLDFLVFSRKNQENGKDRFAKQINAWENDIKYINGKR